jgi:hypothetical protein
LDSYEFISRSREDVYAKCAGAGCERENHALVAAEYTVFPTGEMFYSALSDANFQATLLDVGFSGQRCAAVASGCLNAERPPKLQQLWWRFSESTTESQRHGSNATGAGKLLITGEVFLLPVARAMTTLWLAKVFVGQVS